MKIATSLEPGYTPQCSPNILDRRYKPTDAIHFRLTHALNPPAPSGPQAAKRSVQFCYPGCPCNPGILQSCDSARF